MNPLGLMRRIVQVTVPGLFLSLTACGGNMEAPKIEINHEAKEQYEVLLHIEGVAGPFDLVEAQVNYSIENEDCVPPAPFSGARDIPRKVLPLSLQKVAVDTYKGIVAIDAIKDANYFGRGICRWKLVAVSVDLKRRNTTFHAAVFHDDLMSERGSVSYFPGEAYRRNEITRLVSGAMDIKELETPNDAFSLRIGTKEIRK